MKFGLTCTSVCGSSLSIDSYHINFLTETNTWPNKKKQKHNTAVSNRRKGVPSAIPWLGRGSMCQELNRVRAFPRISGQINYAKIMRYSHDKSEQQLIC